MRPADFTCSLITSAGVMNTPKAAISSCFSTLLIVAGTPGEDEIEINPGSVLGEVVVRLKKPPRPVLDEAEPAPGNYFRFRLSPEVVVAMATRVKKPGEAMVGERIELLAHYERPGQMEPYERLLGDALEGDATLFARQDAVEESWRVVNPVLGNATPLHFYDPNTWGPPELENLLAPEGGWQNPAERETLE